MTTPAAEEYYRMHHNATMMGRKVRVFNPLDKPLDELPWVIGFNNGGSRTFLSAVVLAQDGTFLGGHCCSHEDYMWHDLGMLEETRPDRADAFAAHYPEGYRCRFVTYEAVPYDKQLQEAIAIQNKIVAEVTQTKADLEAGWDAQGNDDGVP